MNVNQAISFIFDKLSAGNYSQNIGFYTLIALLAWIWVGQVKQKQADLK